MGLINLSTDNFLNVWSSLLAVCLLGLLLDACVHTNELRPDMLEAPKLKQEYRVHWDKGRVNNTLNVFTVSHNGKYLVAGGLRYGIRLYSTQSRRLLREFIDPGDREIQQVHPSKRGIYALVFSADDNRLVTGDENSQLTVWQVETGAVLQRIDVGGGRINALAISASGGLLAVGTQTGQLRIYDVRDMTEKYANRLYTFGPDNRLPAPVTNLAFSQHGHELAVISGDERFSYLWHYTQGQQLQRLPTIPWGQQHVGAPLQGNYFANRIQFWDMDNLGTFQLQDPDEVKHGIYGTAVAISADQTRLVRSVTHGEIQVWDLTVKKLIRTWKYSHRSYPIDAIHILPDNKTIAVLIKQDHVISFRDMLSGEELLPLDRAWVFSSKPVYINHGPYALSADGSRYLVGLRVIDTQALQAITEIEVENAYVGTQQGAAISTDNRLLAGSMNTKSGNYLAVWELDSKRQILKVEGNFGQTAFTHQNKNLLYLDREYRLHNISLATAKEDYVIDEYRLILEGREDLPRGIDIRVVGDRIFIAVNTKYDHGYIAIHDAVDGRRLGVVRDSEFTLIRNFTVSDDGRLLAVCSKTTEDSPARLLVLDTRTGKRQAELPKDISPALLTFMPDRQTLLVIDTAQIGHYWDLQKNTIVQQTRFGWEPIAPRSISNPLFSPDGKRLYIHGTIWDSRSARLIFPAE